MKQPEIRFNGFEDEWVEKKLNDILLSTPSKKFISNGQVGTKYPVIQQGDDPIKEFSDQDPFMNFEDVVLFGDHTRSLYKPDMPFLIATDGVKILSSEFIKGNYLLYLILEHLPESQGYKRHLSILKNQNVTYSRDLNEQQKIGALFSKYDAIIALRDQKLAELNALKKGMLQQMFVDGVATSYKPQVRFNGFSDEWIEKKLGDVFKKESIKNSHLEYGPSKIISLANLYYKNDLDNVPSDSYMKTYNVFKVGDIAFEGNKNKNYTYGRFIANTLGDGVISHVFEVYNPKVTLDTNYLGEFINYEPIMGRILRRTTKSTTMMTSLVSSDFLKEVIQLPTLPEQQKIGQFFKQLDARISNEQSKIEQLKVQKQGLLQRML